MKTSVKNLIVGLVSAVLLSSCSGLLKEHDISGVTASSLYNKPSGFEDGVNAAYQPLRNFYGGEDGATFTVFGTDIWTNGSDGGYKYYNQYTPSLNSQSGLDNSIWTNFYTGINSINTVLSDTSVVKISKTLLKTRIGELKFLRALYYFDLVRFYGAVPLHLKPTNSVITNEIRTPELDVYKAIISDLNEAIANLPVAQSEWGRATKGAAEQLLAMVYLRRGYLTKQKSDFEHAASLAETIINSGQYHLLSNFADIFKLNNEKNAEVIFSVQFSNDPLLDGWPGNWGHMLFGMKYDELPGMERSTQYWRPFTRFKPTKFLLNLWNTKYDSRYQDSFVTTWIANDAATIPKDSLGNPKFAVGDTAVWMPDPGDSTKYHKPYLVIYPSEYYKSERYYPSLSKWDESDLPDPNYLQGAKDFIVFRLGETYLIATEALYDAGDVADATKYVNILRERAALPGKKADMDVTPSQLNLNFIMNEWARETAGEYRRWFDLTRTGMLVQRVKEYNLQGGPNIQSYNDLRPIPQPEIDAVTNSNFKQNPGY